MKEEGNPCYILFILFLNQEKIKMNTNTNTCDSVLEIQDIFLKILKNEEDISVGVAAIKTLLAVIEQYKGIFHIF